MVPRDGSLKQALGIGVLHQLSAHLQLFIFLFSILSTTNPSIPHCHVFLLHPSERCGRAAPVATIPSLIEEAQPRLLLSTGYHQDPLIDSYLASIF